MELSSDFEVAVGVNEAWDVLNDVERIAPCLPGAQLQEVEGDEFRGLVKVKVGPITANYKGKAVFVEQDLEDLKVVLKADGRDTRGAGNASALITATLEPLTDGSTRVRVDTDLVVTGKVAQFGRGVMADVSTKLMSQFAENLRELLEGGDTADDSTDPTAAAAPSESSDDVIGGVKYVEAPEPEAVDLLDAAGAPVLKRVLPVLGIIFVLLVLRRILRSRND
jgi:carbon monoxide dehydrogenase subunit G